MEHGSDGLTRICADEIQYAENTLRTMKKDYLLLRFRDHLEFISE